eukprot:5739648-Amphidinium_carterae.1
MVFKQSHILALASQLPESQGGLHIIRQCLSFCKVAFLTRVTHMDSHRQALDLFDIQQRQALDRLLGSKVDDRGWAQGQLGIAQGGLGLRSPLLH